MRPPMPPLIIRNQQLEALDEAMSADFRAFMAKQLRKDFPGWSESLDDGALDQYIRRALKRARAHGLDGKEQGTFVVLSVVLGEDFDTERGWARKAFADEAKAPALRVAAVVAMARDLAKS